MSKKAKRILMIIIIIILLTVYFVPPLIRYYRYHEFIISPSRIANSDGEVFEGSALNTLGQKPVIIELNKSSSEAVFSLGYAEVCMNQDEVQEIKIDKAIIIVECDKYSVIFFPPTEPFKITDIALDDSYEKRIILKI